ncbi:MAG: CocE/NonD family hydrolase [Paracoccaceae bacterium]
MSYRTDFPFALKEIENIFVPLPDGTRLAGRLWLPEGAGRVPLILEYLPYRKRDGTRGRDEKMHRYLARHGYACLRLDIRGCGDSDGLLTDEYSPTELQDGVEAIRWLAGQDWCDGQVAMYGISWGGFNGLQIAALQPPELKTIITVGSTDDRFATDIHRVGGCLSKDDFDWSSTMFAYMDLPPDPAIVGERWRAMWEARREANAPWILTWLRHQRRDDYWRHGSVCEDFARIRIPVYAVSGWADNYSESVPRLLAGLTCPRRGLIGPWAHSFPHDASVAPEIGWLQEVLRWCDHWLKGRATGIMDEPMLRVWIEDSFRPQTLYTVKPGRWVGEAEWPSPRIGARRMPLGENGRLAADGRGEVSVCSPLWVGLAAGEVGRYGDEAEWATDQREDDGGSLVWVTGPLPETVEILGAPKLHLRFRSDRPQALASVRLNEVWPDGASARVGIGHLNLAHRFGHGDPQDLTPGAWTEATIELDDIAHSFAKGNRIAVSVSTTYWPIAWPSPEPATLTIALGASALELPVRPPDPADATLRAFDPPEAAAPDPVQDFPAPEGWPLRRRVTRDLLSGETVVDFPRNTYAFFHPALNQTHRGTGYARYTITDGDPLSARCETSYTSTIERPDAVIGHESEGSLTCDATHFRVRMRMRLTENGQEVFAREWDERIARDHL